MKRIIVALCFILSANTFAATLDQRTLELEWNTALLRTYNSADTFDLHGDGSVQASIIDFFRWHRCGDPGVVFGGAHPTYRGGTDEAYSIAHSILQTLNKERNISTDGPVIMEDLDVPCQSL